MQVITLWELIFAQCEWMPEEMHGDLRRGRRGDLGRCSRTFWGRKVVSPCASGEITATAAGAR